MNSISNSRSSSSAPIAAQSVVYNNTTSGLQATNVQDAIDEVAQGLGEVGAWTFVGSETGTTPISIFNYKEIMAVVSYGSGNGYSTFVINADSLDATTKQFRSGFYSQAAVNGGMSIAVTSTSVQIGSVYFNGTAQTSSATISVYKR